MKKNDLEQFAKTMHIAAEATSYQLTQTTLDTYLSLLKNKMTIEEFKIAVERHLFDPNDGMFFPKPANLIKQLTGTKQEQAQAIETRADIAWQGVESEMRSIGSYGNPRVKDGLALAAIKAVGGWVELCKKTNDQLTWVKKEFIQAYINYENTPVEALPEHLSGRIEIENEKKKRHALGLKTGIKSIAEIANSLEQMRQRGKI